MQAYYVLRVYVIPPKAFMVEVSDDYVAYCEKSPDARDADGEAAKRLPGTHGENET